ncbi:hypothetical protein SSS_04316 [Sarcoptes scabiei]|nr:hypothetical protein SSS_04316 [Sarcoptes scabiei]
MSLYDNKRFILSHIRHSFITCDDTGMCETVMLNDQSNRFPYESIYYHSEDFSDLSDAEYSYVSDSDYEGENLVAGASDYKESDEREKDFKFSKDEIDMFQKTEIEYQSEYLDEDQPAAQSLDIMYESFGARRRSNTAQKLDMLKQEQKEQSNTKTIIWKCSNDQTIDDERIISDDQFQIQRVVTDIEDLEPEVKSLLQYDPEKNLYYETDEYRKLLFPKIELESKNILFSVNDQNDSNDKKTKPIRKSLLSMKIEQSPEAKINPFNEFTKYDGRISDNKAQIKRIRIFFNFLEKLPDFKPYDFTTKFPSTLSGMSCGSNWIEIVILANARVCDLIGLICWHYTNLQIGPPLKPTINAYALKMAEENGDVDNDFPCLTFTDEIKRYGFPCLAMVSIETQIIVTIY